MVDERYFCIVSCKLLKPLTSAPNMFIILEKTIPSDRCPKKDESVYYTY